MSQTDPVAELLTRIRNAVMARYSETEINYSRLREAICQVLKREGFLASVEARGEGPARKLVLGIRYGENRAPIIRGLARVSRPSVRRYATADRMPRVAHGFGIHVLSTSAGIMTDHEARRRRIGGEVLLRVW